MTVPSISAFSIVDASIEWLSADNYGTDKICDYAATIEANTKVTGNPARKAANAAVRQAEKDLAAAQASYAVMLAGPAIPAAVKNAKLIAAAQRKTARAEKALATAKAARDAIPAKLPASQIDPNAQIALLRAGRRGLQMVLRLLAHNAEHWLSSHLNAYLQDDDEYRAITRQSIIRGLAGTITYTPAAITVRLDTPGSPRVARALALLIEEINNEPPAMPGDTRPITYALAPGTRDLTTIKLSLPEIWDLPPAADKRGCARFIQWLLRRGARDPNRPERSR